MDNVGDVIAHTAKTTKKNGCNTWLHNQALSDIVALNLVIERRETMKTTETNTETAPSGVILTPTQRAGLAKALEIAALAYLAGPQTGPSDPTPAANTRIYPVRLVISRDNAYQVDTGRLGATLSELAAPAPETAPRHYTAGLVQLGSRVRDALVSYHALAADPSDTKLLSALAAIGSQLSGNVRSIRSGLSRDGRCRRSFTYSDASGVTAWQVDVHVYAAVAEAGALRNITSL